MSAAWIMAARRTPIGRFLGDFRDLSAPQLASHALRASLDQSGLAGDQLDEVIVGQVISAGSGQAPARQAMRAAGIPDSVGAATVNKVCGSGMYAVMLAARSILAGQQRAVLAGGMESMSQAPFLLRRGRTGWKYGSQPLLDAIELDGLSCAASGRIMGLYAERVAQQQAITREAQDAWGLRSHRSSLAAQQRGDFASEIVPVPGVGGVSIGIDAGPRSDTSLEQLASLRPAFDPAGSVTAGNASTLSDGAASLLVVDRQLRERLSHLPACRILGMAVASGVPEELFVAPVEAIRRLLDRAGVAVEQIDLFEINEAFACQTLACQRLLGIAPERLNVNGGAIALGHPIGCSGARVLVTLFHALHRQQLRLGVASLCLGGGEAVAMLIAAD
jgi:acetyl-CoA C-acetyltransferase